MNEAKRPSEWNDPRIKFVLIGYSSGILGKLDALVPAHSVVVVDEADVIESRAARAGCESHPSFAFLAAAHTQDEIDVAAAIDLLQRPPNLLGVLAAVDYGVVWAAHLAEAWGVRGAGAEPSRIFRDKSLLRAAGGAGRITQPVWAVVSTFDEVRAFASSCPEGVVLKPTNLQASVGVRVVTDLSQLETAWTESSTANEPKYRASTATPSRVLIERRLIGREVSVEALVLDGVLGFTNVTGKTVMEGLYPVEIGHIVPADLLDHVTEQRLREAVALLVKATGFGTGVLHSEWFVDAAGEPNLVECAARLPGDGIDELISLAYGVDFVAQWLELLVDGTLPLAALPHRTSTVLFLSATADEESAARSEEAAKLVDGVQSVDVKPVVASFDQMRDSGDRNVAIVAVGASAEEALSRAGNAAAEVLAALAPSANRSSNEEKRASN